MWSRDHFLWPERSREINRIDSWTGGNGQRYNFTKEPIVLINMAFVHQVRKTKTNLQQQMQCTVLQSLTMACGVNIPTDTSKNTSVGVCVCLDWAGAMCSADVGKQVLFFCTSEYPAHNHQRSLINHWPYFTKPGNSSPESRSVYSFTSVRLKSITLICITVLVCSRVHLCHSITYTNQNVPL